MDEIQRIDADRVEPHIRRRYTRATLIAVGGNGLLLGAKGLGAWMTGSSAIYADAANSASDLVYSVLMMIGLWLAIQPADAGHPHGHRRIEPLVSLAIGVMMALAGIEAARMGIDTWRAGPQLVTSVWAPLILCIAMVVKIAMYYAVRRLGRAARSPALLASARDNLADVLTSGTAIVGVLVNRLGIPLADPVAALLVSLWIFRSALEVLRESFRDLVGGAASPELSGAVIEAVRSVPGVLGTDRAIQVRVDVHINMRSGATLDEVHRVSHAVRAAVEAIEGVDHAFVHVEPMREAQP